MRTKLEKQAHRLFKLAYPEIELIIKTRGVSYLQNAVKLGFLYKEVERSWRKEKSGQSQT